jgi:hypothetical protein
MIAAPVVAGRETGKLLAHSRRTAETRQFANATSHLPVMVPVGKRELRFARQRRQLARKSKIGGRGPNQPITAIPARVSIGVVLHNQSGRLTSFYLPKGDAQLA